LALDVLIPMSDARPVSDPVEVLSAYEGCEDAEVEPLGGGLINATYLVRRRGDRFVLQRVNPIFAPGIHDNIRAVTEHLADKGMVTPRLVPTAAGTWYLRTSDAEIWRMMTWVDGSCFDVVQSTGQARAAGELVGRFHTALDSLDHTFLDMRVGVHDTPAHLAKLRTAVAEQGGHRLHAAVGALATAILGAAEGLEPLPKLPDRPCHGDLKLNNVRFAGPRGPASEQAVCLIDLDTVGPMHLGYEIGDALRSWCNPGGEDRGRVTFDLDVCTAALDGYTRGRGRGLSREERGALLLGVEWVSLELSARFAADALLESYFGWDPERFPGRGEHNLARAESQWVLFRAVTATRDARARLLELDV
jgi:Ser/Thr protein kinase RdoA (MazF antagonist)